MDVLVVGAGPHALTVAAYLRAAEPGLRLLVADPDGWLHRWYQQFDALRLPYLRSACVHHPDPDPYALLHHARDTGRGGELHGEHQCPGTQVFADFCADLTIRLGLDRTLVRQPVRELLPRAGGGVTVDLGPSRVEARQVVVATNPTRPRLPVRLRPSRCGPGAGAPDQQVAHSDTIDLRHPPKPGERVIVVGGGLTAAQLALTAARAGARTTLLSRRPVRTRAFDTGPEWLGRALPAFHAEPDAARRLSAVRSARGGGTVPAPVRTQLQALAGNGRLDLVEGRRVTATAAEPGLRIRTEDRRWTVDQLWLGTGHLLDWRSEPLLAALARRHPAGTAGGLPTLDAALRWPGTDIHVVGGLAALSLGPAARNITGARMAAERVRRAVVGPGHPSQYPHP